MPAPCEPAWGVQNGCAPDIAIPVAHWPSSTMSVATVVLSHYVLLFTAAAVVMAMTAAFAHGAPFTTA